MKIELRENMYYRTISGHIGKIVSINDFNEREYLLNGFYTNKDTIKKANYNIIDLIEVGDYVNGLRVEKNKYGELYTSFVYYGGDIGKQSEIYTTWLKEFKKDMIHSIVTHEQMEQMAYKVGE